MVKSGTAGDWSYQYDGAGLLREVRRQGDWQARFTYDHKGRLALAEFPGRSERYLYGPADELLAVTDAAGAPLSFTPHDFRRIFATDAIMNGMPPHIAQLILGHKDINTTMGYKAVYPEEAINGHRAFIARRRELRPSEEYRAPTDSEWEEFLGHFERRRLALGDCGRAYGTACIHEHACFSELTV